jgi:hypothetical protein
METICSSETLISTYEYKLCQISKQLYPELGAGPWSVGGAADKTGIRNVNVFITVQQAETAGH